MLRITKARPEDRGLYVCTVENVAGRAQASAIVEVEREQITHSFHFLDHIEALGSIVILLICIV